MSGVMISAEDPTGAPGARPGLVAIVVKAASISVLRGSADATGLFGDGSRPIVFDRWSKARRPTVAIAAHGATRSDHSRREPSAPVLTKLSSKTRTGRSSPWGAGIGVWVMPRV